MIVAFCSQPNPTPVQTRARADRLRALPQFTSIVAWLVSALWHSRGEDVRVVQLDDVDPVLRDRVSEEAVRALAALDPIAEGVARRRARQTAAEQLARVLSQATDVELKDPEFLSDRGAVIADAVLERYRMQLVYGAVPSATVRS